MIRALILWLALAVALPAAAQGLPDWQNTSVNDFAGLLSDQDTETLDKALIALNRETGVEGTVVTLQDRARYGGSDGLEDFATRLFNHWGVGNAERNDGFMVLILADDREARIELGAGYPREASLITDDIMHNTMLPAFRAGQMSRGIRQGTQDVIQYMVRPHAAGHQLVSTSSRDQMDVEFWIARLAVFGVFGFVAVKIGQSLLRNVLGNRRRCPRCGNRDLIRRTDVSPTSLPGGAATATQMVEERCLNCGWSEKRTEPIPVSSGGWRGGNGSGGISFGSGRGSSGGSGGRSSGGFGGGRSGGGGSSGKW